MDNSDNQNAVQQIPFDIPKDWDTVGSLLRKYNKASNYFSQTGILQEIIDRYRQMNPNEVFMIVKGSEQKKYTKYSQKFLVFLEAVLVEAGSWSLETEDNKDVSQEQVIEMITNYPELLNDLEYLPLFTTLFDQSNEINPSCAIFLKESLGIGGVTKVKITELAEKMSIHSKETERIVYPTSLYAKRKILLEVIRRRNIEKFPDSNEIKLDNEDQSEVLRYINYLERFDIIKSPYEIIGKVRAAILGKDPIFLIDQSIDKLEG